MRKGAMLVLAVLALSHQRWHALGEGEGGLVGEVWSALGALSSRCRGVLPRVVCGLVLPRAPHDNSAVPVIPCTDNSNLTELVNAACPRLAGVPSTVTGRAALVALLARADRLLSDPQWSAECRLVEIGDSGWQPEPSAWTCPQHTVQMHTTQLGNSDAPGCELACPHPVFSDGEWHVLEQVAGISNGLTALCLLIATAVWLVTFGVRFPACLVGNMLFCALGLHASVALSAAVGLRRAICDGDVGSEVTHTNTWCHVQGVLLFSFCHAVGVWWFFVLLQLHLSIAKRTNVLVGHRHAFVAVGWCYCLVLGGVGCYLGVSPSDGFPWCFVDSTALSVLLWTEMSLLTVVGLYLVYEVRGEVRKVVRGIGQHQSATDRNTLHKLTVMALYAPLQLLALSLFRVSLFYRHTEDGDSNITLAELLFRTWYPSTARSPTGFALCVGMLVVNAVCGALVAAVFMMSKEVAKKVRRQGAGFRRLAETPQ